MTKAPKLAQECANSAPHQCKPATMQKRIGNTIFHVGVHFSATSTETLSGKILRLIANDAKSGVLQ